MPRPRKTHQRKSIELVMNAGVVNAFNAALEDPLRDRPKHGKRGEIIESLLRSWLVDNGYTELLHQKLKENER